MLMQTAQHITRPETRRPESNAVFIDVLIVFTFPDSGHRLYPFDYFLLAG